MNSIKTTRMPSPTHPDLDPLVQRLRRATSVDPPYTDGDENDDQDNGDDGSDHDGFIISNRA